MARFTQSGSGDGSGTPGPTGPQGPAGADGADGTNGLDGEGFNFRGEWVTDTLYLKNDVVTQNGSSYIANYDYQSAYGPSSDGELWSPIALKGTDGADGAQGDPGPQGDPGADGADANLDTGTTTINSYNPVWSGTGLAYTNTPATGSYIKIGNFVIVQIDVIFTNVSNFGTGAYSLTLPFASKYHTDVYGGSLHKITNQGIDHYSLKGHLAPTSSNFTLWAIGSSAADQAFKNNTPVGIDTDDKFHMSFSYICE